MALGIFFFSPVTKAACPQGVEGYGPEVGELVMRDLCSEESQTVKPRSVSPANDMNTESGNDLSCDYETFMK